MPLSLRTPRGSSVGEKSWPLRGQTGDALDYGGTSQSDVLALINGNTTYEQMYRRQVWIYVVVNKLTRAIASLPIKCYSMSDADGTREQERTAPPMKLLRKPWPRARTFQFFENLVGHLGIYGNATFVKFRGGNGRTPQELWPMPWRNVEVIRGKSEPIEGYRYVDNNIRKLFHPDDVVHFAWFNPSPLEPYGVSPIEPLAVTLALENASQRYGVSSFGNAARPASFIQSTRNLTKEQRVELRAEIEAAYGGPENAFKVALLDNGLDWKPLGHSAQESALIDSRKLSREEVCAAYDIPPPMVGILDHATYSNIDQQHWMLYMDTLAPILKMIEDTIMAQVIDLEPAWDGFFMEFDLDAKLRGNFDQKAMSYYRMLQSGVATPNELRKYENREPITDPAADAIYVPRNLEAVSPEMRKLEEEERQQRREEGIEDQERRQEALGTGEDRSEPTPPSDQVDKLPVG